MYACNIMALMVPIFVTLWHAYGNHVPVTLWHMVPYCMSPTHRWCMVPLSRYATLMHGTIVCHTMAHDNIMDYIRLMDAKQQRAPID